MLSIEVLPFSLPISLPFCAANLPFALPGWLSSEGREWGPLRNRITNRNAKCFTITQLIDSESVRMVCTQCGRGAQSLVGVFTIVSSCCSSLPSAKLHGRPLGSLLNVRSDFFKEIEEFHLIVLGSKARKLSPNLTRPPRGRTASQSIGIRIEKIHSDSSLRRVLLCEISDKLKAALAWKG